MEYVSHQQYSRLLERLQKETPKGTLKEGVEEGNAFTAALAKTKKGEKAKVDGQEITDTSGYDDPTVKQEASYTDNYEGSWGYREGMHTPPLQATGPTVDVTEETSGFSTLTPDERKQLKEYIESVKTIQKEIARLVGKAGKKVKAEGGDMTGLVMTPATVSEVGK